MARGRAATARLTEDCRIKLRRYDWPGNIREPHNVIERAVITSTGGGPLDLRRALPAAAADETVATETVAAGSDTEVLTATQLRDFERANLLRALEQADWKISGANRAAERLGLNPNTLSSQMKALDIQRPHS